MMNVHLVNEGPVTIIVDTREGKNAASASAEEL